MNEFPNTTTQTAPCLQKSVLIFRIYGGLFIFSIVASWLIKPLEIEQSDALDMVVGLPAIAVFIMAPIGLYYSIKSLRRKEQPARARMLYFLGHAFFTLLALLMITIFVNDISVLL